MSVFGKRIRELRQAKCWTLRELAPRVGIGFTYLSKVETGRLDFGDVPSKALIHRLAVALSTDENELLFLARKVPERIISRIMERPKAFSVLADLDDESLDRVISLTERNRVKRKPRKPK